MNVTNILQDLLNRLHNNVDPRTKNWFLISPIWYLPTFFALYLLTVKILTKIMENRRPFHLKKFLIVYNVAQVIASAVTFYWLVQHDLLKRNPLKCVDVDYSNNKEALDLAESHWYIMMTKLIEFSETIAYILRKKHNQASFLHKYHHISTLFFMWCIVRYSPGGVINVPVGVNMFIHILMYSYYLLSVFIPVQRTLLRLKKLLTIMQMVQFIIMATACAAGTFDGCSSTRIVCLTFIPNIMFMFNLFRNFYIESYLAKPKKF